MSDTINVLIPTALRPKAGDNESLAIAGKSVREVLASLTATYPELGKQIFKSGSVSGGEVNRFINLYVNDEDIRFIENLDTPLKGGDELSIVPAIAGG